MPCSHSPVVLYRLVDEHLYVLKGTEVTPVDPPGIEIGPIGATIEDARAILLHQHPPIDRCEAARRISYGALEQLVSARHALNMLRVARKLLPDLKADARRHFIGLRTLIYVASARTHEGQRARWNGRLFGAKIAASSEIVNSASEKLTVRRP